MNATQQLPPSSQMMHLITGFWTSCCIYNAAKLGIADLLVEKPQMIDHLAEQTHTDVSSLYRVMRAMASQGIFKEEESGLFSNTVLSETLRGDVQGSMKAMAIAQLGDHYNAWGNLLYSIKTGNIAFDKVEGMSVWQYYETHQEEGLNFMKAMSGSTIGAIKNVLPAYDFTDFTTITDVGGGNGTFLMAILNTAPSAKGLVFDEEYVIDETLHSIEKNSLSHRCTVLGGSFFDFIPEKADAYVMKHVLHDWNDEKSIEILRNCEKAMKSNSKLLVIESVIPIGNAPHPGKFMDINMMAMTGGKERTESEFSLLFESAGLRLERLIHTNSPTLSILEVVKK